MTFQRVVDIKTVILLALAGILAFGALAMTSVSSFASGHLLDPFTQQELDDNWEADREFPTGGVESVSAFGRENVAQLSIDSEETHSNTFRRTEGIKTVGDQNFGDAAQVDLYLDPEWEDKAVRAGFWVVGDDGDNARDNLFAILEFVNLEPSTSGDSEQGNHEGWRFWDSVNGWTPLSTDFEYGNWVTLSIELHGSEAEYQFFIDGEQVGEGPGGNHFIRELFLNSYNYGLDEFPTLSNASYSAHWHAGIDGPVAKDDCKGGGHADFGFRNQGQCIQFVNTGKDSR